MIMNIDLSGVFVFLVTVTLSGAFGLCALVTGVLLLRSRRAPPVASLREQPLRVYFRTSLAFAVACLVLGLLTIVSSPPQMLRQLDESWAFWAPAPLLLFIILLFRAHRTARRSSSRV